MLQWGGSCRIGDDDFYLFDAAKSESSNPFPAWHGFDDLNF